MAHDETADPAIDLAGLSLDQLESSGDQVLLEAIARVTEEAKNPAEIAASFQNRLGI